MSRLEWMVVTILFLCFCIYADNTNRRMKSLENKVLLAEAEIKALDNVRTSAYRTESRVRRIERDNPICLIQQLQDAVGDLQKRVGVIEDGSD